jgi:FAD/FMN-containing dehydrogenase
MNGYELTVADPEGRAASAAHYLESTFRGPVHLPGDEHYDAQRATFTRAVDALPALVAEATSPADVRAAVLTAREYDLPFAIQATGHGTFVPSDGGLLLKTGQMAQVLVDPDRRIARVGPGARWSEVIAAAAPFGLAPLSGSAASVGVTGYTLGGGVGWLSRKYGYAADSLLRADVVTADGQLLTATRDRNADLFWALRGGGGNFGVVTGLEFRLYPVARVYGGLALFPIERAPEVLARFREWAPAQPDELTASIVLFRKSPDPRVSGPVLAIRGLYAGEPEDAVRALRPLVQVAGRPLSDRFQPMGYADTKRIGGTASRRFELFERLPDAAIGAAVDAVTREQSPANAVEVRHWGGAIARPAPDAGPVGHRHVPFSMTIDGPAEAAAPLSRYATGGSFLNFLKDAARTHTAYTAADYERLRAVKGAYDPHNVFSRGHVIPPAVTASVESNCA